MDELTAIRQLLAEPPPPAPDAVAAARARLDRATRNTGAPWRRSARRRWRLAVAGGLVAAVAAAFIATQVVAPAGTPPAGALTVHELAYRAAAAASRQPAVPPGQWVFWREKTAGPGCGSGCGTSHVWTTADSGHAAWVYRGKVVSLGTGPFHGQPLPYLVPQEGWAVGSVTGKIPASYAALRSLPRDPRALDRYLGRLRLPPGWGPAPAREFAIIEMMLTSYLMPPRLTAELYRAPSATYPE